MSNHEITSRKSHINNFDLIRLFAAMQVAFAHSVSHLSLDFPLVASMLNYFQGVPIFFGISGFLITSSYIRNPSLKKYARNRAIRIFPAMWVCLAVTIVLLLVFHIIDFHALFSFPMIRWIACQVTFLQFYTPDFLRSWGTGTPNGSLWTIAVELQFYILLPLLLVAEKKLNVKAWIALLLTLMLISILAGNRFETMDQENAYTKLFHVTIVPYFHFFCLGILSALYWEKIKKFFENKAYLWFAAYVLFCAFFGAWLKWFNPSYYLNLYGWIANLLLWGCIVSAAYTRIHLSDKLLKRNDISYGVYIYHMLVVNSLISMNIDNLPKIFVLAIALGATVLLALLSWKLVEQPVLRRK